MSKLTNQLTYMYKILNCIQASLLKLQDFVLTQNLNKKHLHIFIVIKSCFRTKRCQRLIAVYLNYVCQKVSSTFWNASKGAAGDVIGRAGGAVKGVGLSVRNTLSKVGKPFRG